MEELPNKLQIASKLLDEHFELQPANLFSSKIFSNQNQLEEQLISLVKYCIEKDFNRLVNAMYRIDVDEQDFKKAMSGKSIDIIATDISTLIIKRELEKVEMRLKYRNKG